MTKKRESKVKEIENLRESIVKTISTPYAVQIVGKNFFHICETLESAIAVIKFHASNELSDSVSNDIKSLDISGSLPITYSYLLAAFMQNKKIKKVMKISLLNFSLEN